MMQNYTFRRAQGQAMEAGGGIEPPMTELQSVAVPLCYPAVKSAMRYTGFARAFKR